jgi:hypothetical protein
VVDARPIIGDFQDGGDRTLRTEPLHLSGSSFSPTFLSLDIQLALFRDGFAKTQNFSQGPKRGGSGGEGVNTIIGSVQQEDSERASPLRLERAYIKDRPKVDPNYAARL